ncbi:hypothetical protein BH10ACT9_BH10ACT9_08860 [soil metagenome]
MAEPGEVLLREYSGGTLDFGRDVLSGTWWPWLVAVLGVAVVVFGTVLFTP